MKKYIQEFLRTLLVLVVLSVAAFYLYFMYTGVGMLVIAGNTGLVKLAITLGVDVDKELYGHTPLLLATQERRYELAKLLIENGADIDAINIFGETPLLTAVSFDNPIVAQLLIENGADINTKDKEGKTFLYIAASNSRTKMTNLLIENGADVNSKNKDGRTPLFSAANASRMDLVQLLIENGADVNAKDKDGETPLSVVTKKQYKKLSKEDTVADLLRKHGAKE